MIRYILASGSPRRKEILTQVGISFEVIISDCDEKTDETNPDKMVVSLSQQKSLAVVNKIKNDYNSTDELCVIGADTMVFVDNKPMGKPSDVNEAFVMLKKLQGNTHLVCTGLSLIFLSLGTNGELNLTQKISFAERTKVYVAAMNDNEIMSYIKTGEPMDKAGAYGIQGYFSKYIERIEGDYFNVVGFPVCRFNKVISKRYN